MNTFQDQQLAFQNQQLATLNDFQQHQLRTVGGGDDATIHHGEVPAEFIAAKEATDAFFNMDSFNAEFEERKRLNRERFEQKAKTDQDWYNNAKSEMLGRSFGLDDINSLDDVKAHFAR